MALCNLVSPIFLGPNQFTSREPHSAACVLWFQLFSKKREKVLCLLLGWGSFTNIMFHSQYIYCIPKWYSIESPNIAQQTFTVLRSVYNRIVVMVVCSDSWHQTLSNFEQLLYLHWNNLCIIRLWHGIFSFHPFGQTPHFPNYFHSFLRYSGGTGPDATCAGSGVAVFGWGTINHWGGGSFASQFARSVVPQCLAWCPRQGRQLCETQLYSLLGICIRSPVAPHLGPSQFFFQLNKCWVLPCRSGKC